MPLTPFEPKCYQPNSAHGTCPAGHGVHLDVDHYPEPTWVHCLIVDLVKCPHDLEDVTGAAPAGTRRGPNFDRQGYAAAYAPVRDALRRGRHRATR